MITATEVEQELEVLRSQQKQSSTALNLILLFISIVVFAGTGLIGKSLSTIVTILAILLVHELGHWIGMKLFGYRDVRMFFIPFFGAAVAGKSETVSGGRRAIVVLLGPCPGIILGIVSLLLYSQNHQAIYLTFGTSSLFLNGFNLLPFLPLDGGRFLEIVLFSRNAMVEAIFKLIAALGLGCIAWFLKSIPLGLASLLTLIAIRENYVRGTLAFLLQKLAGTAPIEPSTLMPIGYIETILPQLSSGIPQARLNAKFLARRANAVWARFLQRPPLAWSSIVLLFTYLAFAATIPLGAVFYLKATQKTIITSGLDDSGRTVRLAQTFQGRHKLFECPINRSGYFDGYSTTWRSSGRRSKEGAWTNGYKSGDWKLYDSNSNLTYVVTYDNGRPVKCIRNQDGTLLEVPQNHWPFPVSSSFQKKALGVPQQ